MQPKQCMCVNGQSPNRPSRRIRTIIAWLLENDEAMSQGKLHIEFDCAGDTVIPWARLDYGKARTPITKPLGCLAEIHLAGREEEPRNA